MKKSNEINSPSKLKRKRNLNREDSNNSDSDSVSTPKESNTKNKKSNPGLNTLRGINSQEQSSPVKPNVHNESQDPIQFKIFERDGDY